MSNSYNVKCACGAVQLKMTGKPRVTAFCHCEDCRDLLDVPYHSITAWNPEDVEVTSGAEHTGVFQHPSLDMTRVFCKQCGESLYNTNAMNWKLVSQLLISKCNGGELPEELRSNAHFFYDSRIVDINDQIPKQ